MINNKKLVCKLLAGMVISSSVLAGPVRHIKNTANSQISGPLGGLVGVPYKQPPQATTESLPFYMSFPVSTFLDIDSAGPNKANLTPSPLSDTSAPVMVNYLTLQKMKAGDLGLRIIVGSHENRARTAEQLAESNLIRTGDILVSNRPRFAQTLRYLALQLLSTHVSMAVVVTENGKKTVYNVDMPMDADMLQGAKGLGFSTMSSPHFTGENDNLVLHILRPRLTDVQRSNIQAWLELSLKRAREKSIYPGMISFNSDYENPMYRSDADLAFVTDTAKLLIDGGKAKPTQHLQMYCSEFAWSLLSLRNCNPTADAAQIRSSSQASCVKKFFEPMNIFGSGFSSGTAASKDLYGMTDGIMMLAKSNTQDPARITELVNQAIPAGGDIQSSAPGLSAGHKAVAESMKQVIGGVNQYFTQAILSGVPAVIDNARAGTNSTSKRNYSPTAFVVHALMPNTFKDSPVLQKQLDYIGTLKWATASSKPRLDSLKTVPNL